MAFPNSKTRRGRAGHGVAQTLTTSDAQQVVIEPMAQSKQTNTDDAIIDSYRFYQQAIETLQENDCEPGDTIDAYNKRVNKDGVSPTITTRLDGFKTAILPVVGESEADVVWNNDLGCFMDARTGEMLVGDHTQIKPQKPNYRIRKLTERECFRLMGVKSEDFEKVRYGAALPKGSSEKIAKRTMTKDEWRVCWRIMRHGRQSVSSCYHLAGDSIVTACLMAIFGELLSIDYNTKINELTEELKEK